ncbi:MAG: sigma-70 family RNA polymerase sigma factor [Bacteroidaceae bacterium]|nr:sigma-70 family RNA polymerase sigma factor [Bacteroidaceae bacterium]
MDNSEKEFAELVRKCKSTIYTVCYMFSNDEDEVNDLFQEVLVNLWKGYGSFRNESRLSSWVYRVSLNTCISLDRKKRKIGKHVPLDMNINLFEDHDEDTRQIQQLYDRIHRLGPVDRAIILLWLDNLSYEEIGSIVGISTKNVSVKLVRIREKLSAMK